ncbi:MAG: hypothetical protein HYY44_06980, partial [Deltaproteobacteria bacterium]|nr:hypothetical protein [Deltaproteobacteria bacterium]
MSKQSIVTLALALLIGISQAFAEEFRLPSFLPGDTVSSDFFNDIMRKLEKSKEAFTETFLEGSWECDAYGDILGSSSATAEWSVDKSGRALTQKSTITFQSSRLTSSTTNPFSVSSTYNINSSYAVYGNLLLFSNKDADNSNTVTMMHLLNKISDSKINLFNLTSGGQYTHLLCDKQLLPPRPPS